MIPLGILASARYASGGNPLTGAFRGLYGGTGTTTKTSVSFSIGTADATREVIVAVTLGGAATITSLTVAGVSATLVPSTSTSATSFWRAAVPTGTTAVIVCVISANIGILFNVWSVTGGIVSTAGSAGGASGTSRSQTVTAYANGYICAVHYTAAGGMTGLVWTNATSDNTNASPPIAAAHATHPAGSVTITAAGSSGVSRELNLASFGG